VTGRKVWVAGEILAAADVNSYLMDQSIMRFADSTARTSEISSPTEGMFSYLEDTNVLTFYNGSAWVAIDAANITGVTAGTALTGGGSTGDVTLNVNLETTTSAANVANFVTDTTTARTLTAAADSGKTIRFTNAGATTVTVNESTDFAVGVRVDIIQDGAGVVTVTASTATIAGDGTLTTSGSFTIGERYSAATLLCVATDEYRLIGNVTAV